jgi:hypothetical protein
VKGGGRIHSSESAETVEVRREGNRWYWCYANADAQMILKSNDTFDSAEEAVSSAAIAYPDIEPAVANEEVAVEKGTLRRGPEFRRLVVILAAAGLVAAAVLWGRRHGEED